MLLNGWIVALWSFLIVFALVTAVVVLWPLMRKSRSFVARKQYDLSIFKDQLREVERDLERGVIGESEAGAARTEISRKIIRLDDDKQAGSPSSARGVNSLAVGAGLLVVILGGSFGAYALIGTPGLPGKPYAERISPDNKNPSLDELVARVEAHLRKNPDDAKGWAIIAPSYMRLGRFTDAVNALEKVLRIEKPTPDLLASYGEAMVMANNGLVDENAQKAFSEALRLNPNQPTPQFYLGLQQQQSGKNEAAIAIWNKMLANAPANAPWRPQIEAQIKKAGGKVLATPASGAAKPQSDDIPDIGEMVSRLAARLAGDGDDLDGWMMLVRSYMVQKRPDEARKALAKAAEHFKTDKKAQTRINDMRKSLGL